MDAPAKQEGEETLQTVHAALGSSGSPCDVLHLSASGQALAAGGDGRFYCAETAAAASTAAGSAPKRMWAARLGAGADEKMPLTAAAVSADRTWLAFGQEYDAGFGVWVCPLDTRGMPNRTKVKLAARYTLDVRHLAWHPSKPQLAIATDDGRLSIWSADGQPRRDLPCRNAAGGGVRCAAFDPRGDLLAAAFSNGALVVFRLKDSSEVFRCSAWPKSLLGRERLQIAWRPDGGALALPGAPTVKLVARGSYDTTLGALELGHRHPTTAAAWSSLSPDASGAEDWLLASISCDAVAVWRKEQLLQVCKPDASPYSLLWGGLAVIIGSLTGSCARWEVSLGGMVPATQALPETQEAVEVAASQTQDDSQTPMSQTQAPASQLHDSIEKTRFAAIQEAFQPGATRAGRRRYLTWNEHGTLKFFAPQKGAPHASAGSAGRVEVEYSRERGSCAVREVRAPPGLTHGSMGPGLCALAAAPGRKTPARVVVHLSKPFGKPSFEHVLPVGEEVAAIAVGRHFVAVCTAPQRLMRIHSVTGMPLGVFALPGAPISLVACEDLLFSVIRIAGASGETPLLEYSLYGVAAKERLASGRLPLSPGSTLRWVGFSAEAMPLTLDSAGTLRGLSLSCDGAPLLASASGEWLPLAELEAGGAKAARLWPVRAEDGVLHCVDLTFSATEPSIGPVQRLRSVRFHLPLSLDMEGPERLLRQRLLSAHLAVALEAGLLPATARRAASDSASKQSRSVEAQVVKLFESSTKRGGLREALDIASGYLGTSAASAAVRVRLLEDMRSLAASLGQDDLAERVVALAACAAPAPAAAGAESEEEEDESGDGSGGEEAVGGEATGTARPREEVLEAATPCGVGWRSGAVLPEDAPPTSRPRLALSVALPS